MVAQYAPGAGSKGKGNAMLELALEPEVENQ